ncbi:multidrug resistance-associated protein 5 [Tanacetum coccineum]
MDLEFLSLSVTNTLAAVTLRSSRSLLIPTLRKPKVGEKYTSVAQFKECLTYYALANGFSLWYERSGEVRVVAKWMINEKTFQCISLNDKHACVRNFNFGALVNYKWIAKIFSDKIRANPDIRLCDIADLVMKKYKCKVSLNQCTNAKKYALTEYEKSIDEHYSMLRSYGKAILDSNPGSTIKLGVTMNPDGKTYFDRFYVCFAGLADGWKAGCRKIITLDGCFLKSPNQGKILTAIRRDRNNHIYPVSWAVVNVENKDNWTWFLKLLEEDLGCSRGNGLTLIFDQHKGLIEAVKDVMPNAEHRQSSKASYPRFFNKIMDKIKSANPNTHKYLMDKNPKTWSRVFFEVDRGCEATDNGFRKLVENGTQGFWHVIPAGGNLYEVKSRSEGFTVDEGRPRKKQPMDDFKEVDVVQRGPLRDEGASGTRGGAIGSRGDAGSKGGASGSIGRGDAGSKGGASGSIDESEQTQAAPQQTQHEPEQTQVEDQVEQTKDQDEINLTQLEQTQEPTQDQVQEPTKQPTQEPTTRTTTASCIEDAKCKNPPKKVGKTRQ